jgi:hypothetical protein
LRADDGPSQAAIVAAASVVGAVVAYLDLFGSELVEWGGASLFAYATVVAFLAPAAVVVRNRYRRWLAHPPSVRWPDLVIGAAAVALVSSVTAHLIGEGGVLGLLATVLGASAIAYAASRVRS